jgi:hypothetical protein
VIAGSVALARLPVDPGRAGSAGDRRRRQHQIDAHPEVAVEHPGAVVPVGEHPLGRPALAHDVAQVQPRLQLGERRALGGRDVRLADVGLGVEHVDVARRDVHVAAHDDLARRVGEHRLQRREPRELVAVVLGVRHPPVRHVHRDHADPAARRGDRARLRVREARRPRNAGHDILQARAGEDRDAVPRRFAVARERVSARRKLRAEQLVEGGVGELRLLQADHVGAALIQPGEQTGQPLFG